MYQKAGSNPPVLFLTAMLHIIYTHLVKRIFFESTKHDQYIYFIRSVLIVYKYFHKSLPFSFHHLD